MTMTRPSTIRNVYRFLATCDETDGKYATFEAIVPPGSGLPPHIHRREEESFLVLDQHGEYRQ
jgi:mannose-6-phosphate isomerase-like protein (cupin superfamily)